MIGLVYRRRGLPAEDRRRGPEKRTGGEDCRRRLEVWIERRELEWFTRGEGWMRRFETGAERTEEKGRGEDRRKYWRKIEEDMKRRLERISEKATVEKWIGEEDLKA